MAPANPAVAQAADLKRKLSIAERRGKLKALGLIAPLFVFIVVSFVLPIAIMLSNAVYDPDIADNLPNTVASLSGWTGPELPDEKTYAALVGDLQAAEKAKTADLIGKRLNYEISGMRSKIRTNTRKAKSITSPPFKEQIMALDPVFSDLGFWAAVKRAGARSRASISSIPSICRPTRKAGSSASRRAGRCTSRSSVARCT